MRLQFQFCLYRSLIAAAIVTCISGCGLLPQNPRYVGPPERPASLDEYYARGLSYRSFTSDPPVDNILYKTQRLQMETDFEPIKLDYYYTAEKNDDLIFIFPMLGGKNVIVDYFAEYFVRHGFDCAIVHRSNDFKDPKLFDHIEEILKNNVVRDRIAIDFFEKEYGKKDFGSFGLSRGAINVAMTAGIDPRLKYNVMAMGGTDLVQLFKKSNVRKLKFYRDTVMLDKKITKEQFYEMMRKAVKTDPLNVAQYIDAKNTLLFLSVFDRTVPFKYGMQLRKQIGEPRTVMLTADHFTSVLYTQLVSVAPPFHSIGVFPFDYIELESLAFYRDSFKTGGKTLRLVPFRILQMPFDLIMKAVASFY